MKCWIKSFQEKCRRTVRSSKGFTLIEMMVAIGVLAILTTLIGVGLYGYLSSAYTARVNETAKTVFYAAQEFLLEQKQMGQLKTFNSKADSYGGSVSWEQLQEILKANQGAAFDPDKYAAEYDTTSTGYILMERGSNDQNPLYQIVQEATQDSKLLSNAFLLEYDRTTGVVRSVFYSEKTDGFTYGGSHNGKDNVILRSADSLLAKKQGYYGVDITGKKPVSEIFVETPVDVLLYNGERLYLEWKDSNDGNPEFQLQPDLLENLVYDVTACRVNPDKKSWDQVFSIEGIYAENPLMDTTLQQTDDSLFAPKGYRLAYDPAERTYQLILDDIHHSIFDTYTKANAGNLPQNVTIYQDVLAEDTLVCEVTARLDQTATGLRAESFDAVSNFQSSAFAGGEDYAVLEDGSSIPVYGSGVLEDGSRNLEFGISCARHLNNIRWDTNEKDNSNFKQTAAIDWSRAEGRGQNLFFQPIQYGAPFYGSYTVEKQNGNYYELNHLTIQQKSAQYVGLFTMNMGKITGLTMDKPSVEGSMFTGTVAGINGGILKDITITNGTVKSSHIAGGITGYNTSVGTLSNLKAECSVSGETALAGEREFENLETFLQGSKGRYIGGIAGLNEGTGTALTAGKQSKTKLTGTAYVGGIFGKNNAGGSISDVTSYQQLQLASTVSSGEETICFGGIMGYQGEGSLVNGTNYGTLEITAVSGKKADTLLHVGGIAGENEGVIENCLNKGVGNRYTVVQNQCISEIKKGRLPSYAGKYVGGIVGTNSAKGRIKNVQNENAVVTGYSVVGGIVGKNMGTVTGSADAITKGGVVIGTDYLVGGAFGYDASGKAEGYTNGANVFGKGMVGGIMGFNGRMGADGDTKILNYLGKLTFDGKPAYYEALLGIESLLVREESGEIRNCLNRGFVYAKNCFQGGIAGVNYGEINQSTAEKGTIFTDIHESGTADCVGGIAGYNGQNGSVDGTKLLLKQSADVEIVGGSFTGGIAGVNAGSVKGFSTVKGGVYAKGDCAGGLIGLNTNKNAVSELTKNETDHITGSYFVGGIMGCNVSEGTAGNTVLSGVYSETGSIQGTAYVGGILGFNTYVAAGSTLGSLFRENGEMDLLKKNAFTQLSPAGSEMQANTTIFKNCSSKSTVSADRYVGGIVGYNSSQAKLWVLSCSNMGAVKIGDTTKTKPVTENGEKVYYYYIGSITGRNSKSGIIHDCTNNGSVKSPSTYLGGICEVNEGYIQFCSTGTSEASDKTISVESDGNSVGGIVGLNTSSGKVVSCRADQYAKVKGGSKTGGLVGTNAVKGIITSNSNGNEAADVSAAGGTNVSSGEAAVSYCSAVVVGGNHTGGIVGYNQGTVEKTEVRKEAQISGDTNVGGFVGMNTKDAVLGDKSDVIYNLTNYAQVYGNHMVGGIVGTHDGSRIEQCTNSGSVTAIGNQEGLGYAGGITGYVTDGMKVTKCVNYGLVKSDSSFAGGISALNNGELRECNNFGSVEGSIIAAAVQINTTDDEASGSAIGGIAGCNMPKGKIYDCASRNRKDDAQGASKNPFWADSEENKIRGNYIAGGIIGHYARYRSYGSSTVVSTLSNTTDFSREVTITIEPQNAAVKTGGRCRIGGVIGQYTAAPEPETLENYIFSGTINIQDQAGKNQQNIGGIVAEQPEKIILKNCIFKGKILGSGNNPNADNNAGIGGLAGLSKGKIIVGTNKDGIYTSTAPEAVVWGAKRVGGIVGEREETCKIYLIQGQTEVALETVNQQSAAGNPIYYINYAAVHGGQAVGGFFGTDHSKTLSNLKNKGTILQMDINDRRNLGGIAGNTSADLNNCVNEGTIGADGNTGITENVGGIIGLWESDQSKAAKNCVNYGTIYAGKTSIGGLFGRVKNAVIAENCQNQGNIIVNSAAGNTVSGVGGIAGTTEAKVEIGGTVNAAMNLADKSISIRGSAQGIGGIVGHANGTTVIHDVTNLCKIYQDSAVSANKKTSVYAGGIIGKSTGTLLLERCSNEGEISFPRAADIGGIAGYSEKTILTVKNTTNKAAITGALRSGGICGYLMGGTVTAFTGNVNEGRIRGTEAAGGLIGRVDSPSGTIGPSENRGEVAAVRSENGDTAATQIGGCIGLAGGGSAAKLRELVNTGQVNALSSNQITGIYDLGGIVGCMTGSKLSLNRSTNEGKILVDFTGGTDSHGIGGIAGALRNGPSIGDQDSSTDRTVNKGQIQVNGSVKEVGGIAGFVQINSRLVHCRNEADVLGAVTTVNDVGGVAGKAYGLIYSCQTEKVTVTGNGNVGGLVGWAVDYTCKITSTEKGNTAGAKEYDFSYSRAAVKGNTKIGGLVGYQQDATIYNAYVGQGAAVTLLSKGGNANAAGGLVGYADSLEGNGNTKGVISSCYSFAEVTGEGAVQNQPYIGGIIGYRVRYQNTEAATSIVDCYMVDPAQVDETAPALAGGGTVTASAWAVGNEPYVVDAAGTGTIFRDIRDLQTASAGADPLSTDQKFYWSRDGYEALCVSLGLNPKANWADQDAISEVMQNYDGFQLAAPHVQVIRAGDFFSYTFPFQAVAGFYEKFGFKLYAEEMKIGEVIREPDHKTAILEQEKTVQIGASMPDITISLEKLKDYAGQVISVSAYAYGYDLGAAGDQLNYTKKSDEVVMQQFVILPPLPTPKVKALAVSESDNTFFDADGKQIRVKLEIENWEEYEKAAADVYASLASIDSGKLLRTGLYDQFVAGLHQFTMVDGFNTKNTTGIDNNFKITHTISAKADQPDLTKPYYEVEQDPDTGQRRAYLYLDYSKMDLFQNNYAARPWHAFTIQAGIDAIQSGTTLDYTSQGFKYRYVNSAVYTGMPYRLKTRLLPPQKLQAQYTGALDPDTEDTTPGYLLKWEKGDGGSDGDIQGYQVDLLYLKGTKPDGTEEQYKFGDALFQKAPYHQLISGAANRQLALSKETLNQIFTECGVDITAVPWWENTDQYTIGFQVTSIAGDPAMTLNSAASQTFEFPLMKREAAVDSMEVKRAADQPTLTITVNDPAFDPNKPESSRYDLTYELVANGVSRGVQTAVLDGERELTGINIPTDLVDAPFTVKLTARRKGIQSVTLDSLWKAEEKLIGKRLETPVLDTAFLTADKTAVEQGNQILYLHMVWSNPGSTSAEKQEITETSCSGYRLEIIRTTDSGEQEPEEYNINGFDTLELDFQLSMDQVSKIKYNLKAVGIYPNAEDSEWISREMVLANTRLNSPDITSVKMGGEELLNAAVSFERSTWEQNPDGMSYMLQMDVNSSNPAAGQKIAIEADSLTEEIFTAYPDGSHAVVPATKLGMQYAGKTVTVQLNNQSSDISQLLPSEVNTVLFTVPRIRLDQPKIDADSLAVVKQTGTGTESYLFTAQADLFDRLADSEAQTEERNAREGLYYEVFDRDGNAVQFIPVKHGVDQSAAKEYTIPAGSISSDRAEISFRLLSADVTDIKDYRIVICTKAKAGSGRYADSSEAEAAYQSVTAATKMLLPLYNGTDSLLPAETETIEATESQETTETESKPVQETKEEKKTETETKKNRDSNTKNWDSPKK